MIPLKDDVPTRRAPVVTWALIAGCVLVFLWQLSLGAQAGRQAVYGLGLIPAVLLGERQLGPEIALVPPEATVLTSMFLHGGVLHLLGNMLYLWIFGNNVEDAMGRLRFVAFYLLCGTAAAAAQVALNPHSTVPMVGASGAISGVLGAYLLLHPRAHVLVAVPIFFFIQLFRLPAVLVLGFWFVLQLLSAVTTAQEGGGVAFWAHVGGFVAGMALIPLFRRRGVALWPGGRRPRRGPWA